MYLRLLTVVAPYLISGALRLLSKTVRVRFANAEELFARWERGEQVIVALWHDRVVMMPIAYRGRKLCIMNSQHRDGEIATRALARWGIHSVRGSATRGGAVGFMQLVNAFRGGYDLAVVPDGPRGPRHVAVRVWYTFTKAGEGYTAGSHWEQTLLFVDGLRYFFIGDSVRCVM
jgi:lysophospholipid acyltransferase (LPLAT)-like uncharacterized protein